MALLSTEAALNSEPTTTTRASSSSSSSQSITNDSSSSSSSSLVEFNEEKTQQVLDYYQILDTDEEKDFDDITRLAANICHCSVSLVSLLDLSAERVFFKSHYGLPDASECRLYRESALCYHVVNHNVFMEVADVSKHEIFGQNPYVKQPPNFIFYAGAPLITPSGHRVGTLCVLDFSSKQLDDFQRESLVILARQVVSQMELRLRLRQVLETQEELVKKNSELEQLNRDKAKLLGVISHDFKQPLTNTMLCAELLLATSCDITGSTNARATVAQNSTTTTTANSPSSSSSSPASSDSSSQRPQGRRSTSSGYRDGCSTMNNDIGASNNGSGDNMSIQSQYDLVQTIHANAQFMHILVEDMLQMARTDFCSASVELIRRPVNIVRLIHQICVTNSVCFRQKRIELSLNIRNREGKILRITRNPRDLQKRDNANGCGGSRDNRIDGYILLDNDTLSEFICDVDAHKIEQCINNLVSNACKFSHERSRVSILVALDSDRGISHDINQQLIISVSDEGQGIPSDELDLLFQAWKKPSVRPTAGESSTGLGLVIVKNIVEAHSGSIWVESEQGKGSTFYLSLPMPTKNQKVLGQLSPIPSKATCGSICSGDGNTTTTKTNNSNESLTILCAEDNIICQQLLIGVFKKRGHLVHIASDGREALEIFEQKGHSFFDALLVDGEMPKVSGLEVIKYIRCLEAGMKEVTRIPIVSISGRNSQRFLDTMKEAGVDHCCGKPFNTLKLVELVESLCNK